MRQISGEAWEEYKEECRVIRVARIKKAKSEYFAANLDGVMAKDGIRLDVEKAYYEAEWGDPYDAITTSSFDSTKILKEHMEKHFGGIDYRIVKVTREVINHE